MKERCGPVTELECDVGCDRDRSSSAAHRELGDPLMVKLWMLVSTNSAICSAHYG